MQTDRYTGFRIVMEGVIGKGYRGDIAIDDLQLTDQACQNIPDYSDPTSQNIELVSCQFESNPLSCPQWYNDLTRGNYSWSVSNSTTPSANTGPRTDHTGQNGYYIFAESSLPYKTGDKAVFSSIRLPPTSSVGTNTGGIAKGVCVSFWYHMYGPHVGTLNAYADTYGKSSLRWTKKGTQTNKWKQGSFYIDTLYDFLLSFEAIKGNGWSGDIALDDVKLSFGPCALSPECTFDYDFCGWRQDDSDDFDWNRNANMTGSLKTGPSRDHTDGVAYGHYAYIETSSK